MDVDEGPLIGVQVPYFFFAKRSDKAEGSGRILKPRTMRDFVGLEEADKETKVCLFVDWVVWVVCLFTCSFVCLFV